MAQVASTVVFLLVFGSAGLAFATDFRGMATASGRAMTWNRPIGGGAETPESAARRRARLAASQRVLGGLTALGCAALIVLLVVSQVSA